MKHFNKDKKSTFIKILMEFSCLALLLALAAVLSKYASSDTTVPSISIDGTIINGITSSSTYTEYPTGTTIVSESDQIESSVPIHPNTESTESETTNPISTEEKVDFSSPTEYATYSEPTHTHSYSSTVTKESTCTETGVKTYTCACGDSYTKGTAILGHKYEATVVQPTNSAQGYTQYTCIRCNDSYKANYTNPLVDPNHVHSYVAKVFAPNCYKEGYTTYTCSCGRTYKDLNSITQPLGHTWGEWTDCGDGSSTRDCLTCGRKDFKVNEDCSTGYYRTDTDYEAVGGGNRIDPKGDPNGNPADYVAPADPKTGISWDGVSPIIYTYANGSTGTEPKIGATYYINPYRITTVTVYTLGWASPEEYLGGASDGYCYRCGKQYGDGTNGTCIAWMVGDKHTCEHCGETVPIHTCHTCPED